MEFIPSDIAASSEQSMDPTLSAPVTSFQSPYEEQGFGHEEFFEIKNSMVDGGDRFSVSAVAFDGQEELLWMGNQGGHVTSYYGLDPQKYTSFQVHETNEIRQLLTVDGLVFSLTPDSLRCNSKYGRPQYRHKSDALQDMQCMLLTQPHKILMGGHQPIMVELDIEKRKEIRQVEISEPGCAILRFSTQYICSGDTAGKVTLRDPRSLKTQHVLQAHSGTLSDFDVCNNQLVTCGFSNRMGSLTADRFLMLYDLRYMKATTPMPMTLDPMFLRFIPMYSDRICVVSQIGQFQVMEQGALTPASMTVYNVQTEGASINAFDISPSHQTMAFGDAGGFIHLFGTETPVMNPFSKDTEFAPVETLHASIDVNNLLAPYSLVPMQYPAQGKLASDWPEELCQKTYRKAPRIDPEIIRTVKMVSNVGYAPNPGGRRRNQMQRPTASSHKTTHKNSVPDSPLDRDDPFIKIPKRYRKVEIKYSKLGVEDFDFWYYNKTNFAGLETQIPNAYCNAMVQVLYTIEPLRVALIGHLCDREFCLACELGFLFHMLDLQKGKACQASNFLRAFRTIPEASALSLVLNDAEESMGKVNLRRLIQNWNRFLLQQIHTECSELSDISSILEKSGLQPLSPVSRTQSWSEDPNIEDHPLTSASPLPSLDEDEIEEKDEKEEKKAKGTVPEPLELKKQRLDSLSSEDGKPPQGGHAKDSAVKSLFGLDLENVFTCNKCGAVMKRSMTSSANDLSYPELMQDRVEKQYLFAEVLQRSLCSEQNTQAWCNVCKKYQPHVQTKVIESLPDILSLNCHLESTRELEFWRAQEAFVRKKYEGETTSAASITRSAVKLCRYGLACTRKDCKFRHDNDGDRSSLRFDEAASEDKRSVYDHSWLPVGLQAKLLDDGKVLFHNIEDENDIPSKWAEPDLSYYELHATVAYIKDQKTGGHLISHVNMGERYHQRKERVTCTQWYLFNDFAIQPIERQEAVSFNLDWKIPCVVYYMRKDITARHSTTIQNPITADVLFTDSTLVTPRRKHVMFAPLDRPEIPVEGEVVGLDAEFVTLNQEEAELRSDGTRSTIKPSHLSVARITCIRGKGPLMYEPFIDDYISTQEAVVDYLTQFSGIQPGDLDAAISQKHLTTLKSTYLKLRYLIDRGCLFVGHGLKKDFRVINLVIKSDQVIDTVDLFHLPRQRMISLKFLAWYFLGTTIQSDMHDSIEDARTALRLYHKYQEMCKEGMDMVRETLKEMYETGRKLQWKVTDAPSPVEIAADRAREEEEKRKKEEKEKEEKEDEKEKEEEEEEETE
ncbi:hypothetical protein CAPTEDRAFT_225482 [Capitella teleta]|uniref:PAN2-PAN3 deadenylation complex catalytic subunit PAN2 n=1 Tax=Capitella teleta TaxID=283909 RepID=R7UIQ4_CAPTE|nr:hypothetical protein CAPTEDRAFT_225482 [Capitella teleta]|eukprot:ELU03678.1 hypothetical protein CAPTEDRAFT_225482 [Capitella teleta]